MLNDNDHIKWLQIQIRIAYMHHRFKINCSLCFLPLPPLLLLLFFMTHDTMGLTVRQEIELVDVAAVSAVVWTETKNAG